MMALALVSLAIWMVLLFARGRYWQIATDLLPDGPCFVDGSTGRTAEQTLFAIVPARNEAGTIAETLPTLLSQRTVLPFHVVLVDDHSEDATVEIALRAARASGCAERLTIVAAGPLPSGWTGKLWALQQGLTHIRRAGLSPDRILFTDADIAYGAGTLARLVSQAGRRGVVLASLMVKLRAESSAERWLVPAFVYFFKMLYPFGWVNDPRARTAAAAGGVVLCDRAALERAGGLFAIRGALIDDCALGQLMKKQGPIWLGLTRDVVSVRPYPVFADIRQMVVRSAYTELRRSPLRLVIAISGLALVFLVPPLAAIFGGGSTRLVGLVGWMAMAISYAPMQGFYGLSAFRATCLPAIAAIYGLFTIQSAIDHQRGCGGLWKGRVQTTSQGVRS